MMLRVLQTYRRSLQVSGGVFIGLLALPCLAQGVDGGALLRQQTPLTAPSSPNPTPQTVEPLEPATSTPSSGRRIFIRNFRLSSLQPVMSDDDANALLAGFRGRELTLEEMEQAATRLARAIQADGYPFTHAYIPPQEISDATVTIAVVSGRLARDADGGPDIQWQPESGVPINQQRAQAVMRAALPNGEAVKQEQLERGMLLLNSLAGVRASGVVVPGPEAGTVGLLVRMQPEARVDAALGLDNAGGHTTGEWRTSASLDVNSPARVGDSLSLRLTHSIGTDSLSSFYALPIGDHGLKATLGAYHLRYKQGKELAALRSKGSVTGTSAGLTHPLILQRRHSLYANVQADLRKVRDFANGDKTSERELASLSAGLQASHLLRPESAVGYGFSLVLGELDRSGVETDQRYDRLTRKTQGGYAVLRLNTSFVEQFSSRFSIHVYASGQAADSNLDSAERLYPGGPRGVRAYRVDEPGADEGALLNIEGRWRPELLSFLPQLALVGFADAARLRTNHSSWSGTEANSNGVPNTYSLKGAGIGLSYDDQNSARFDLYYAYRLGGNNRDAAGGFVDRERIWFTASVPLR
jgi:hemolysin activation/secretion protein